ncbi:hypothetical protein J6590_081579 [Homalodisca vitripennis]|nr:hypothetical protein J6590_081579 [Homalodisca vitripennis]
MLSPVCFTTLHKEKAVHIDNLDNIINEVTKQDWLKLRTLRTPGGSSNPSESSCKNQNITGPLKTCDTVALYRHNQLNIYANSTTANYHQRSGSPESSLRHEEESHDGIYEKVLWILYEKADEKTHVPATQGNQSDHWNNKSAIRPKSAVIGPTNKQCNYSVALQPSDLLTHSTTFCTFSLAVPFAVRDKAGLITCLCGSPPHEEVRGENYRVTKSRTWLKLGIVRTDIKHINETQWRNRCSMRDCVNSLNLALQGIIEVRANPFLKESGAGGNSGNQDQKY